jgi:hypothetical protein
VDDPGPDPDPDPSSGGVPVGGYSLGSPVRSPGVMPLEPCEKKCQKDYEDMAANCGSLESAADRKRCADSAYAAYKSCRGVCQQNTGDDDCLEHCKEKCDQEEDRCRDACHRKKVVDRPACYGQCSEKNARCLRECEKRCK